MGKFTIDLSDGRSVDVEAPDEAAARSAVEQWLSSGGQAPQKSPQEVQPERTPPTPDVVPAMAPDDAVGRFAVPGVGRPLMERDAEPQTGARQQAGDVLPSFASGVVRGVASMATLPGAIDELVTTGVDSLMPGYKGARAKYDAATGGLSRFSTPTDAVRGIEGVTGPLHKPTTTAGEYAHTIGEFAPGSLAPGGLAQRALNSVVPAVASETAGQLTKGTNYEGPARFAAGLLAPSVTKAGMSAVTPVPATSLERTRLSNVLDAEGVTAQTAGQRTGNRSLQWWESALSDMPASGGRAGRAQQQQGEQFTAAALRRSGTNADRATADVIDQTFTRLGDTFNRLSRDTWIDVDGRLENALRNAQDAYLRLVPEALQSPLFRGGGPNRLSIVDEVIDGQFLSGREYQALRSAVSRMAREATDPQVSRSLRQINESLDDAVGRQLPPNIRQQWQEVRNQYRNLIAIENAIGGAGSQVAEGLISPQQLRGAVQRQDKRSYVRGQGDFADMARAGEAILRPLPQSGTTPRAVAAAIPTAVAGAAGLAGAGQYGAAATTLGAAVAPSIAGRALMSSPVQGWLSNQALANLRRNTSNSEATALALGPSLSQRDKAKLEKNKTFALLTARGVPEDIAAEAVLNPQMMMALLREMQASAQKPEAAQ